MSTHITTPNMLEIAYLLSNKHTIVSVSTKTAWPYGIEELAVTMEGRDIDLDHANFLRHGQMSLRAISQALSAVQTALELQQEAAFLGGQR